MGTLTDRIQTALRPANNRSRATNKPAKMVLDQRSAVGRRLKDLADAYAESLGGWPKLSDAQAAAVRRAAEMVVLAEQARHEALRNGVGDPDRLVQLENLAARAVKALSLDRKREPEPPSQSDHLGPQRRAGRFFRVIVRNHMKRDEEVARFCAEHGVTSDDFLFVRCFIPYECRPGETAKEAYERELRSMANQEALPDARESARLESAEGGSATEITATASTGNR